MQNLEQRLENIKIKLSEILNEITEIKIESELNHFNFDDNTNPNIILDSTHKPFYENSTND